MNYFFLLALCFSCCLPLVQPAYGQRILPSPAINRVPLAHEPVAIVCLNHENSDEWLKSLAITVKNISGRSIFELELNIALIGSGNRAPIYLPLRYQAN